MHSIDPDATGSDLTRLQRENVHAVIDALADILVDTDDPDVALETNRLQAAATALLHDHVTVREFRSVARDCTALDQPSDADVDADADADDHPLAPY